jgi:hypothetical protein
MRFQEVFSEKRDGDESVLRQVEATGPILTGPSPNLPKTLCFIDETLRCPKTVFFIDLKAECDTACYDN